MSTTENIWNALAWWNAFRHEPELRSAVDRWYRSARASSFDRLNVIPLYEALKHGSPLPAWLTDPRHFEVFFKCQFLPQHHSRQFLAQFGDVLRFPIPPGCESPDERFLKLVWLFKPALSMSVDEMENCLNSKRLMTLPVVFNPLFSTNRIANEIKFQVDSAIRSSNVDGRSFEGFQPKLGSFVESLRLYNEFKKSGLTFHSFARQRFPEEDVVPAKDRLRFRIEYIEQVMAKISGGRIEKGKKKDSFLISAERREVGNVGLELRGKNEKLQTASPSITVLR